MSGAEWLEDPADTRESIMRATYLALCEYGYADLTIQRIGDEFEKSKSLLYHHYDGKDELLLDFLSFVLEKFEADVPVVADEGAHEQLEAVFDHVLDPNLAEERADFRRAMVELRAQAATDRAYAAHFTRHDEVFRDRLADLIEAGIEEGTFREVDPRQVAEYLHTLFLGAMTRGATTDEMDVEAIREELDAFVETRLLDNET